MGSWIIGVDGGGTKTLGAIAGHDGKILGQAEVGSTNYNVQPIEAVRENLGQLIQQLLAAAGGQPAEVETICLGMSGVDRPEDRPVFINLTAEFLPNARCEPVNDAIIALMGGLGEPRGIVVIAGTGSIAYGYNGLTSAARCGGWGNILGDEGSGYALGYHALRAVMRAHDGRGEPTKLRDTILATLSLDRPEQLLGWLRENKFGKAEIASLSVALLETAESGDKVAAAIAGGEAAELALQVATVARKLFGDSPSCGIVVAGSNLRKNPYYFGLFEAAVTKQIPGARAVMPEREPVEGAVLYAKGMLTGTVA